MDKVVLLKYVLNTRKRLAESWQWYLLLLPALIYIIIFSYVPMYGLQIAFKDYRASKGILGSPYIGLSHFIRFVEYPYFWKMVRNTLSITLYSLAVFPCPVLFALMLNEVTHTGYKKTVQMITYMPHFLSEVVVCSMVILLLDRTTGPINNLIDLLGGTRQSFLSQPSAFASIYVWSGVWQGLGWSSILYISALSAVDSEQIEAARIDGANKIQIITHVNIPCIMPTIIINFIMQMGRILSVGFSKVYLLQNDMNIEASNVISVYVYNVGLLSEQFSYSSAIGLFNTLVNVAILLLSNAIMRRISETSLF